MALTQKKKKIIFAIIFFVFVGALIAVTYDMARQTSKPWNKEDNNILEKYKVK